MSIKKRNSSSLPLIVMDQVVRQVKGPKQSFRTLLRGVSWSLHAGDRVAILARKRAEADAFLECACGVASVQTGSVTINANVSWPLGRPEALLSSVSARHNAEFLLRIYGDPNRYYEQMNTIRKLSDLPGDYFERPLKTYNSPMRARFRLALSLAFEFDVYSVPFLDAWNYAAKNIQAQHFREQFELNTKGACLLVSNPNHNFQKAYCDQGIVIHNGEIIHRGDLDGCQEFIKNVEKS